MRQRGAREGKDHKILTQIRHQQPIHNEPRSIFTINRDLFLPFRNLHERVNGRIIRLVSSDDLDELHRGNRIEVVKTGKFLFSCFRDGRADLGDRERGGVGGEDAVGP